MTADDILTAPVITEPARIQYDTARRWHEREALLAHLADRHQDWLDERECEAVLKQYVQTELYVRPRDEDTETRRLRAQEHDTNAREGWRP